MKTLLSLLFILGVVGLNHADDKNDPTAGKWVMESYTREGKPLDNLKGAIRENSDGKYSITPANAKAATISGTYTIDTSKTPIAIDMKPKGGNYDGKTLQGILKLDGDTLTIAFSEPGKDRPAKFEGGEGSGIVVTVLKKVK